jgi:hypothetical protein
MNNICVGLGQITRTISAKKIIPQYFNVSYNPTDAVYMQAEIKQ